MTSVRAQLTGTALGLALALLSVTSVRAQNCQLTELASLPMDTDRDGALIIPVTINGTPEHLAVNMGSSIGVLSSRAAESLQLKLHPVPESMHIYASTGDRAKSFATIASLTIGAEHAEYTDVIVNPSPPDDDGSVAGLIGHDILKNFDLDFDFGDNKLNLFSLDHCEGKVVYWAQAYTDAPMRVTGSGFVEVAMKLDGHDVDAIIDTGSTATSMTLPEASAVFGVNDQSPGVETTNEGVGEQQHSRYRYRFKTLSLSGITVNNPLIDLVPDAIGAQSHKDLAEEKTQDYQGDVGVHTPHLMLGTDVMRHLHLYIAYKEHKIYATAADARRPPPPSASPPSNPGH